MDLRKLKEKATEAFAKGKFAKAAELYEAYCAGETKDLQARLRMGDAFAKAGAREKAIGAYKMAAEGYARDGFLPRAIAASKLILELDPTHRGVQHMLADLYAKRSAPDQKRRTTTQQAPAAQVPSFNEIDLPTGEPPSREAQAKAVAALPSPARLALPALPALPPPSPPPAPAAPASPPAAPVEPPARSSPSNDSPAVPRAFDLSEEAEGGFQLEVEDAGEAPKPGQEEVGEIIADAVDVPTPTPPPPAVHRGATPASGGSAPPGLKPKRITTEIPVQVAPEEEVVELTVRKQAPIPPTPMQFPPEHASAPATPAVTTPIPATATATPVPAGGGASTPKPASRIWLPETFTPPPGAVLPTLPAAPVSPEKVARSVPPEVAAGLGPDLETLAKFDELDLDMAPLAPLLEAGVSPGSPGAPSHSKRSPRGKPPGIRSFTELELEGDSLLHAVEMAAEAGLTQRSEAPEPERAEESMTGIAEDFQGESKTPAGLPKIPLFSDLSADAFIELFDRCPLLRFGQGERIIEQGSVGDSFFVICAGAVRVVRKDDSGGEKELAILHEGAFFGEMALLSGAPRTASVISHAEETQLLGISATVLAQLSHRYPQVAAALKKFCRQRLLANVMSSSPLFKPFNRKDRKELVERFRARDVKKNDLIIKEGALTDGLYVVLSGEVKVRKGKTLLATLREGEVFGEISLLQKSPATATVVAAKRTSLLRLPREAFDQIILTHPQVLMLVSELSELRQRHNAAALSGELLV